MCLPASKICACVMRSYSMHFILLATRQVLVYQRTNWIQILLLALNTLQLPAQMSPAFNYYLWERPLTCVIGLVSKIAFPFYFLLRSLLDAGEDRVGPFFDRVFSEGTEKACKLHPPGLLFPKSRFYNVGKPSDRNRED